jgi:hypothetical protein
MHGKEGVMGPSNWLENRLAGAAELPMKTDRQTDRQAAICHGMVLAYAGRKKVFLLDGEKN